jgi:alpha-amylase
MADTSYLPASKVLKQAIVENKGKFKIALSISGTTLDQFELYAPEVLESFQDLAKTGCVEFLGETDSHSLVSLANKEEFAKQVQIHREKIKKYFNQEPTVFRNTELIYSDQIGNDVLEMGFEAILTEGAKHILGWKSPDFLYCSASNPRLKLLLRNFKLSDDIAFKFSNKNWNEYPLTAEKYKYWLDQLDPKEENVNLFFDFEALGGRQPASTGILNFIKHLPHVILHDNQYSFSTPSEIIKNQQPIAPVSMEYPISWADEERDLTAWLGNDMQSEAFNKLYSLRELVNQCIDQKIQIDWKYLQNSDHFYYMSTKFFTGGSNPLHSNPFGSPYEAFINYMNILSDFTIRIQDAVNLKKYDDVDELRKILHEKDQLIAKYQGELSKSQLKKAKSITKPKVEKKATNKPDAKNSEKEILSIL